MRVEKFLINLATPEGRNNWLALRKNDVTTGDLASLMGVGYDSPLTVHARKRGLLPPLEETDLLAAGRHLEKGALSWARERFPEWDIRDADVYLRDVDERIGSTPDFVAIRPDRKHFGAVDCKVVASSVVRDKWQDGDKDAPLVAPEGFVLQVNIQAAHMAAAWGGLLVLELGEFRRRLHFVEVEIDPEIYGRAVAEARSFWADFDAGRLPAADPSNDGETVKRLWRRETAGKVVDLSGWNEAPALLAIRDAAKANEKAGKEAAARVDVQIKEKMGDAAEAIFPGGRRVTWKTTHYKESFTPARDTRVLRVGKA